MDESSDVVDQFRARFGLTFPILWDPDKRVSDAYQAYRYPETLLIGRDGVVVERYVGPRDWDSPLYEARIRRLLEGAGARARGVERLVRRSSAVDGSRRRYAIAGCEPRAR